MMQATTKNWLLHFEYPHHLHDVNDELHEMVHDRAFLAIIVTLFIAAAIIGLFALGIWLGEPPTQTYYNPTGFPPYYGP